MYSLIALIAGIAAKLYDDLEDNELLQKFHNNTLIEFLKGIHYITFTSLSIEEPVFFIIQYLCNIVYQFGNNEAYNKPYEKSLLYSFLLLFVIIDYKKIISICLIDKLIIILSVVCFALEPIFFIYDSKYSEYSFSKIKVRCFLTILYTILHYLSRSGTLKCITAYFVGYLFISFLVQCYSVRIEKLTTDLKEKETKVEKDVETKEEKDVETKETKEVEKEEAKEEVEKLEKEEEKETKEETKEKETKEIKETKEKKEK